MSARKILSLIVSLAILGLVVFAFVQMSRHPRLRELRTALKEKSAILVNNFLGFFSPGRTAPLTTVELEEYLKANLAVPFTNFNQEDWDWFWRLLYGRFAVDEGGWPKRKRQLTKQEVQDALTDYYYRPFGSFGQREWNIFWQHILKGRVFKR